MVCVCYPGKPAASKREFIKAEFTKKRLLEGFIRTTILKNANAINI